MALPRRNSGAIKAFLLFTPAENSLDARAKLGHSFCMSMDGNIIDFPKNAGRVPGDICFNRKEFSALFSLYGRMVAAGEWRDYAVHHNHERALFSIFRRASEQPVYTVEKRPKNAEKQGAYCVMGQDGRILRRGKDLAMTLRVLDKKLMKIEKE